MQRVFAYIIGQLVSLIPQVVALKRGLISQGVFQLRQPDLNI